MTEATLRRVSLPRYTFGEELFNSISHGIGSVAGIACLSLMVAKASTPLSLICACLFGATIIATYGISCAYHALPADAPSKRALRVLDHCGVFLLVFGTYIPASLLGVGGPIGWTLFAVVGLFTVIGIVFTAIDVDRFSKASVACHLVSGWSIVAGLPQLYASAGSLGMTLIVSGGIAYTLGSILYGLGRNHRNMHCVFHVFCLLGTACHFTAIYAFVL